VRGHPIFAACGVAALLAGCPEGNGPARSEAGAVSRAVDSLREADNAHKSAPLAALRAVKCSLPDVCSVQSRCVAAYEAHVHALELIADARASIATAPAASATQMLDDATKELSRSKARANECATGQGELVRKYHLQ
jgi:hypothetical protein